MNDVDVGLSTDEVCKLAGVSFRQLDYWCRLGGIVPSISDATGSGTRRRWSTFDAQALRAIVDVHRDLASIAPGNVSRDFVKRMFNLWYETPADQPITLDLGTVVIKLREVSDD